MQEANQEADNHKGSQKAEAANNARVLKRATQAAVLTAALLILIKLIGWKLTGSVSILASLVDSMLDVVVSFINLLAVRYALMPPDSEHRFGHGKAEPLVGFVQVGFISASAVFLIVHAFDRLASPVDVQRVDIGVGVMLLATLLTLALVLYQRRVVKQTKSTAIAADSLHYLTDVLTNISVLVALVLSTFGWKNLDAVVAIFIAVFILFSAMKIGVQSFHHLMDHEIPEEEKVKLLALVHSAPEVLGMHDLRTRQSGQRCFIQMHLDLDENLSLREAHRIVDDIELRIKELIDGADVIVHPDPIDPNYPRTPTQSPSN